MPIWLCICPAQQQSSSDRLVKMTDIKEKLQYKFKQNQIIVWYEWRPQTKLIILRGWPVCLEATLCSVCISDRLKICSHWDPNSNYIRPTLQSVIINEWCVLVTWINWDFHWCVLLWKRILQHLQSDWIQQPKYEITPQWLNFIVYHLSLLANDEFRPPLMNSDLHSRIMKLNRERIVVGYDNNLIN